MIFMSNSILNSVLRKTLHLESEWQMERVTMDSEARRIYISRIQERI